jgi:group II intron reverse transcriptase/maturase
MTFSHAAGVFLIARSSPIYEFADSVLKVITFLGASTAFFAATVGLLQNDLKKVIAFSTCSQLGYMIFACGLSNYSAGIFHLSNHAFFKALLFLGAGSVIHAIADEQDMGRLPWYGRLLKQLCIKRRIYYSSLISFCKEPMSRAAVIDWVVKDSMNEFDTAQSPDHVPGDPPVFGLFLEVSCVSYVHSLFNASRKLTQRENLNVLQSPNATYGFNRGNPNHHQTQAIYQYSLIIKKGHVFRSGFVVTNRREMCTSFDVFQKEVSAETITKTLARFPEDLHKLYPFDKETQSHLVRGQASKLFHPYINRITKASKRIRKVFSEEKLYTVILQYEFYLKGCNFSFANYKNSTFIYRLLSDPSFLLLAHAKLKGDTAPGLDNIFKENVTLVGINRLSIELKNQSYKCRPVRRVYIDKPGTNKKRPFGVASTKDKIVQMALKMLLEPLFEPYFYDISHGFRPKKSCHTCLKQIFLKGRHTIWFIEMDLIQAFDKVSHKLLIHEIRSVLKDSNVIDLLYKMLRVGYVTVTKLIDSKLEQDKGTPQGSVISPLLANIFFHRLDRYILERILPSYNERKKVKTNPEYRDAVQHYGTEPWRKLYLESKEFLPNVPFKKIKQTFGEIRKQEAGHKKIPYSIPMFRSLWYSRYVDDAILGFCGPKKDAIRILQSIAAGIEWELAMSIHPEKSGIRHHSEGVIFLGYKLLGNYGAKFKWDDKRKSMETSNYIKFSIPKLRLLNSLKGKGFLQIGKKGKNTKFVARRVDKWIFLPSDYLVLQRFNAVTKGIANYYSGSFYPTPLIEIYHLLMRSAALTLAHRHKKRTAKWSFEKWGKALTIETTITKKGKEQTKTTRFFLPHKENYTTPGKWKVGKDKSGHLEEV